jgi:putative membrane protein
MVNLSFILKIRKMKMIKTLSAWVSAGIAICCLQVQTAIAQQTPKLADDEIASVAVVANQNDIDFAGIAQKKSKNSEVLQFAKTMSTDHKAVIDQAVALVTKLKVTPKDNAVSKQLTADAKKTEKMLNARSGKAFDKAYIDNEVAYHKSVIGAVENVLIPQAQNAELKALLQQVLPTLKTHLEHAEMVQSRLSK